MVSNELVSDCLAGNEEAIQVLVRTHQRSVFQLALSILDCTGAPLEEVIDQAEIVTRQTFVTALDRMGRYRDETPFHVWLSRIVIEVSQKRFRTWQRQRRFSSLWNRLRGIGPGYADLDRPSVTAGESGPQRSKTEEALLQTVLRLDNKLRLPVVLRYFHELPVKEIASILRLSEGAVHARLDQAREKLAAAGEPDTA